VSTAKQQIEAVHAQLSDAHIAFLARVRRSLSEGFVLGIHECEILLQIVDELLTSHMRTRRAALEEAAKVCDARGQTFLAPDGIARARPQDAITAGLESLCGLLAREIRDR
jgi:hypothetical protein